MLFLLLVDFIFDVHNLCWRISCWFVFFLQRFNERFYLLFYFVEFYLFSVIIISNQQRETHIYIYYFKSKFLNAPNIPPFYNLMHCIGLGASSRLFELIERQPKSVRKKVIAFFIHDWNVIVSRDFRYNI